MFIMIMSSIYIDANIQQTSQFANFSRGKTFNSFFSSKMGAHFTPLWYLCPMEYLQINPNDTEQWGSVWNLYEESFPEAERRKKEDHLRAAADTRFFPLSVWEGRDLIGLMFFWEWESYRYLEHLAVK